MKKFVSILLSLTMLLAISIPASAATPNVADQDVAKGMKVLRSSGLTPDTIHDIYTDEQIAEYADLEFVAASDPQFIEVNPDGSCNTLSESTFNTQSAIEAEYQDEVIQQILSQRSSPLNPGDSIDSVKKSSFKGYLTWYIHVFRYATNTSQYHIAGYYKWVTSPSDLGNDVFAISFDDAFNLLDEKETGRPMVYTFYSKIYMLTAGQRQPVSHVDIDDPSRLISDVGGVAVIQNLNENCPSGGMGYSYTTKNQKGHIGFDVELSNSSSLNTTVIGTYFHQKNEKHVNISVSIPKGASASLSDSSWYDVASNNPTVSFGISR